MCRKIYIFLLFIHSLFLMSCDTLPGDSEVTFMGTGGNIKYGINYFPIEIPIDGEVVKVDKVSLISLNYAVASDLEIRVEKVGSALKNIVKKKGGSNAFVGDYTFVDNSDEKGLPRLVTYTGVVVPEIYQSGDFYDFKNCELLGSWHLIIIDWTPGTDGTLRSWQIRILFD
jgi:hypothetical protein